MSSIPRNSPFNVAVSGIDTLPHLPAILNLATKYCWWKTPEESLAYPQRVIAAIMDKGTFSDIQLLLSLIGEEGLRDALSRAEPGQFRPRSWAYWQYRLNGLYEHSLSALPRRVIP